MILIERPERLRHPQGSLSLFLAQWRGRSSQASTLFLLLFGLLIVSPRLAHAQPPQADQSPSQSAATQENLALGTAYLNRQEYAPAMERFEAVLADRAGDSTARSGELQAATALALEARAAGKPDAALSILQHARLALPDDPILLTRLGIQAQQMRLPVVAAEALATALAIAPKLPDALYALARVEIDQDRLMAAEAHLRAYLEQRPDDASAHFGLGHVLERQQRTDDAAAEFKRSITLKPAQTESYFQLGQMALDVHQDEAAHSYFRTVLARDPTHGGALTGDGILAYRRKDFTVARARLSAAVVASPEYQPAHYYLGLTLARVGEKANSERELKIAIDLARKQQGKAEPLRAAPIHSVE